MMVKASMAKLKSAPAALLHDAVPVHYPGLLQGFSLPRALPETGTHAQAATVFLSASRHSVDAHDGYVQPVVTFRTMMPMCPTVF